MHVLPHDKATAHVSTLYFFLLLKYTAVDMENIRCCFSISNNSHIFYEYIYNNITN